MTEQKLSETENISFRLPKSLLSKAKTFSDQQDLTLSQTIRRALMNYGPLVNQQNEQPQQTQAR
jgi:hypothetical protein